MHNIDIHNVRGNFSTAYSITAVIYVAVAKFLVSCINKILLN